MSKAIPSKALFLSGGLFLFLAGCSLPSSMPMRDAMMRNENFQIVQVDRSMALQLSRRSPERFGRSFTRGDVINADRIRPGDKLSFQIFENVDTGLFGSSGHAPILIGPIEVDGAGMVSLPYAGRIKASGLQVDDLRSAVEGSLAQQTPDPQVIVMYEPGSDATVTVSSTGSGSGIVPLHYGQRRLRAVLAAAGGVQADPSLVNVEVTRGKSSGRAQLDLIRSEPDQNIALRPGDVVSVNVASPRVSVLGSAEAQGEIELDKSGETLVAALSKAGGLNTSAGDAKGLFVMRSVASDDGTSAGKASIYVFDLAAPEGIFAAGAFALADGDVVYVSEVGISRIGRALRSLLGFVQPVGQIARFGG